MPVLELAIVNIISGSVLQMVRSTVAATDGWRRKHGAITFRAVISTEMNIKIFLQTVKSPSRSNG